ncbi:MAG: SHOCT domain-containing protein [Haloarculaceae archaeon]
MAGSGPLARARGDVTGITALLVTGIWLAALLAHQDWWLAFMLFGYVVLVPLVAILSGEDEAADRDEPRDAAVDRERADAAAADRADVDDEALATLRDRYARGELTDEQFERKLQRLLETDSLEDLEDAAGSPAADRESERP